jgi:excisionase family DNA binding protein
MSQNLPLAASVLAVRCREAAQLLSISERTLWSLTKQGKIPCLKLGEGKSSAVLYSIEVLKKFVSQISKPYSAVSEDDEAHANDDIFENLLAKPQPSVSEDDEAHANDELPDELPDETPDC